MQLSALAQPRLRPYLFFVVVILGLLLADGGEGRILTSATAYSTLQTFSIYGLVALGLGLTMLIGEFDLSVAGVFGVAGCVAVLTGGDNPWFGLLCAVGVGVLFGAAQGTIITFFRLGSVPVTLGGLLTGTGLSYVLTQNQSLSYEDIDVALALNNPVLAIFSIRSLLTLGCFVLAALVFRTTRIGRDLIATGSDRRAARTAGVSTRRLVIGSFTFSGAAAALGGATLSYALASASPTGLADILVPATAAVILGGVSLTGGVGTPLGIAAGVLTFTVLRSGLVALAAPPFAHDVATGVILVGVAVLDAPYLLRRLREMRRRATG